MKVAKKILAVLIFATAIELFVFNFGPVCHRIFGKTDLNKMYVLSDFETMNWTENTDSLVSGFDPMLILDGVNAQISILRISSDCLQQVPYVNVFYTNDQYVQFGEGPIILEMVQSKEAIEIEINDNVENLRIDLGDEAGVVLNQLTVVANPSVLQISVARIVAIILIAFCSDFLLSLQRYPVYFTDSTELSSKLEEDGKIDIQR